MDLYRKSDRQLLTELGGKLRQERLEQNQTQTLLASKAGVDPGVLRKFEAGKNITLINLLSLLRALGKLEGAEQLLPPSAPSPLQLSRSGGRVRQRARPKAPKATLVRSKD